MGSDLTEFIATKSGLYEIASMRAEKNLFHRYIIPGRELQNSILSVITDDSDLIPMVTQPEK